jgi:hypothetical protein
MKNVNLVSKEGLPENSRVLCFDLKGSKAGRDTAGLDSITLLNLDAKLDCSKTFKDTDFAGGVGSINLSAGQYELYSSQLKKDAEFFAHHNIIDYSLVMFITIIPYSDVISKSEYQKRMMDGGTLNSIIIYNDINLRNSEHFCALEEQIDYRPTVYRIKEKDDINQFHKIAEGYNIPANNYLAQQTSLISLETRQSISKKSRPRQKNKVESFGQISLPPYIFNFPLLSKTDKISSFTIINKVLRKDSMDSSVRINDDPPSLEWSAIQNGTINEAIVENERIKQNSNPIIQIYYDSKSGRLMKRMICCGIIDYLTVRSLHRAMVV